MARQLLLEATIGCLAVVAAASPVQIPLSGPRTEQSGFVPVHHLSAISPYFRPHPEVSNLPPTGCVISRAVVLVRHSSITANDDEYDETMGPFIEKLESFPHREGFSDIKELAFLKSWLTPVNDSNLEEATDPGRADAKSLGRRFSEQYKMLMPTKQDNFSVWTASSDRDIETAKAWILGAVPEHAGGGIGDGHVRLIKVPNKDPDWADSLTPHKICPRFSKESGKPARDSFRRSFGALIAKRLNKLLEGTKAKDFEFDWVDVVAMIQLCGYETAIKGTSPLCKLFLPSDLRAFSYGEDLYYDLISGYGAPWVGAVGIPWLELATQKISQGHPPHGDDLAPTRASDELKKKKGDDPPIPKPTRAPNETNPHQMLNVYFTHREEPPVVVVALGLLNSSVPWSEWGQSSPTAGDDWDWGAVDWSGWEAKGRDRLWNTNEIIPFLGHVAVERLECITQHSLTEADTKPFVRVLLNETPKPLPDCDGGPGGTCALKDFLKYVKRRRDTFGDFEEVCKKPADA